MMSNSRMPTYELFRELDINEIMKKEEELKNEKKTILRVYF